MQLPFGWLVGENCFPCFTDLAGKWVIIWKDTQQLDNIFIWFSADDVRHCGHTSGNEISQERSEPKGECFSIAKLRQCDCIA